MFAGCRQADDRVQQMVCHSPASIIFHGSYHLGPRLAHADARGGDELEKVHLDRSPLGTTESSELPDDLYNPGRMKELMNLAQRVSPIWATRDLRLIN